MSAMDSMPCHRPKGTPGRSFFGGYAKSARPAARASLATAFRRQKNLLVIISSSLEDGRDVIEAADVSVEIEIGSERSASTAW